MPHGTFTFFTTGDWNRAVADGMAYAGLTGPWTTVTVHTDQTINHGVETHDTALARGQCHAYYAQGRPVRMNLQGALGYALKGPATTVCTQCHEWEGNATGCALPARADYDRDADVDLTDYGHLQACLAGEWATPPAGCGDAALDGDLDADQADVALFITCLSGPGV